MQKISYPSKRKYFTIVLNLWESAGLNPYEFRLLIHYARVGNCYESVRTTARKCSISVGAVGRARDALEERGFITVSRNERRTLVIAVVDKWRENTLTYGGTRPADLIRSPGEQYGWLPEDGQWAYSHFEAAQSYGPHSLVCVFCGEPTQTLDHWIPKSAGGSDDDDNLVASCDPCNKAKDVIPGPEYVDLLIQRNHLIDDRPWSERLRSPGARDRSPEGIKEDVLKRSREEEASPSKTFGGFLDE